MTYWIYGFHSVEAALSNAERKVKRVLATEPQAAKLKASAENRRLKCEIIKPADI